MANVVDEQTDESQRKKRPSPAETEKGARPDRENSEDKNGDSGSDQDVAHARSPRDATAIIARNLQHAFRRGAGCTAAKTSVDTHSRSRRDSCSARSRRTDQRPRA